jgi:hypothetical protein
MEAAVLEAAGVSADVFQKSLLAHQHNQLLQQCVMTMQVDSSPFYSSLLCLTLSPRRWKISNSWLNTEFSSQCKVNERKQLSSVSIYRTIPSTRSCFVSTHDRYFFLALQEKSLFKATTEMGSDTSVCVRNLINNIHSGFIVDL